MNPRWFVHVTWETVSGLFRSVGFTTGSPEEALLVGLSVRDPGCEVWIEIVEAEEP